MQTHVHPQIGFLLEHVQHLRRLALTLETSHTGHLAALTGDALISARNLLHYLGIRQLDLREVQRGLSEMGLSSLGRLEAHTMYTLEAIIRILHQLSGSGEPLVFSEPVPVDMKGGAALLQRRAERLMGRPSGSRSVRIMVTMPSHAADDPHFVERMLLSGMDIMRINCAHDTPDAWLRMIDNLKTAMARSGLPCKIYADLGGPKLRTGPIAPAGRFIKLRPARDVAGAVTVPARAWLAPDTDVHREPDPLYPTIPVTSRFLERLRPDNTIRFRDARGKKRRFVVREREKDRVLVESMQTCYVPSEAILRRKGGGEGRVGDLPTVPMPIVLRQGDALLLTRGTDDPGRPAVVTDEGYVAEPARIGCTLDAVFDAAVPGDTIWFDDGKIGGVVVAHLDDALEIRITHAGPAGSTLRSQKGINLPDTELAVPALTQKDLDDLALLVPHIDIAGLSFVRTSADVDQLEAALTENDADHVGMVFKIETRQGFRNLPHILLAGLKHPPFGIMVARGDLAVEVGFERMAEVQEQMLWLCEAAHVPIIWATQVLEDLARTGLPSRAEVTDAAMSGRAECVMLNKGPYIAEATRFLSGVLHRMEAHQSKKRSLLRRLSVSDLP